MKVTFVESNIFNDIKIKKVEKSVRFNFSIQNSAFNILICSYLFRRISGQPCGTFGAGGIVCAVCCGENQGSSILSTMNDHQ